MTMMRGGLSHESRPVKIRTVASRERIIVTLPVALSTKQSFLVSRSAKTSSRASKRAQADSPAIIMVNPIVIGVARTAGSRGRPPWRQSPRRQRKESLSLGSPETSSSADHAFDRSVRRRQLLDRLLEPPEVDGFGQMDGEAGRAALFDVGGRPEAR